MAASAAADVGAPLTLASNSAGSGTGSGGIIAGAVGGGLFLIAVVFSILVTRNKRQSKTRSALAHRNRARPPSTKSPPPDNTIPTPYGHALTTPLPTVLRCPQCNAKTQFCTCNVRRDTMEMARAGGRRKSDATRKGIYVALSSPPTAALYTNPTFTTADAGPVYEKIPAGDAAAAAAATDAFDI